MFANRRNFCVLQVQVDGDVIFQTGSRNKAVWRICTLNNINITLIYGWIAVLSAIGLNRPTVVTWTPINDSAGHNGLGRYHVRQNVFSIFLYRKHIVVWFHQLTCLDTTKRSLRPTLATPMQLASSMTTKKLKKSIQNFKHNLVNGCCSSACWSHWQRVDLIPYQVPPALTDVNL